MRDANLLEGKSTDIEMPWLGCKQVPIGTVSSPRKFCLLDYANTYPRLREKYLKTSAVFWRDSLINYFLCFVERPKQKNLPI